MVTEESGPLYRLNNIAILSRSEEKINKDQCAQKEYENLWNQAPMDNKTDKLDVRLEIK